MTDTTLPRGRGRPSPGITLAGLRAFAAVVEHGGFSAAAAALGMTQPSVSAQVIGLEEACGVRLLLRHGRAAPALTEDGRALLLRARLVLSRFDEFERVAGDHRSLRQGRLVLGFSAPGFAMPLLARFEAAHPAMAVATRIGNTASLLADLAECRIDIGVMSLEAPRAGFACVLMAELPLGLVVRRDDPWAPHASVPFAALRDVRLIHREQGSMTRALLERHAGFPLAQRLEVGSREAQREAVAAGLGRGYGFLGDNAGDGRLAFLRLAPEVSGGVYAVALREMEQAPAVAAMLALAAQPGMRGDAPG